MLFGSIFQTGAELVRQLTDPSVRRMLECRLSGSAEMTQQLAGRLWLRAVNQYGLIPVQVATNPIPQMYNYLTWRFGGPDGVCSRWASEGDEFFFNNFTREAAAIVLGLLDANNPNQPVLILPPWFLNHIRGQIVGNPMNCGLYFISDLGVDPNSAAMICAGVARVINNPVPVFAMNLTTAFVFREPFILRAIQARMAPTAVRQPSISISPPMR